jgi:hypothetical protein
MQVACYYVSSLCGRYVSIRSIRQHTQHTSAYAAYVSIRSIRQHTQHTSAYAVVDAGSMLHADARS